METLINKCETADGRAWFEKYAHPPSAAKQAVSGIPDRNSTSSVVLEWRNEVTVGSTGLTVPTGSTWSMLVVTQPNPQFPALTFRWVGDSVSTATEGPNFQVDNVANTNFNFGSGGQNFDAAVSQFRPVASSVTGYLDSAALYDQGRVYAAQVAMEDTLLNGRQPAYQPGAFDAHEYSIGQLPDQGTTVLQATDKSYNGLARDGCYMPLSFTDPAMSYCSAQSLAQNIFGTFPTNNISVNYNIDGTVPIGAAFQTRTYPGMTVGLMLWKGLLVQETVELKFIHMWEALTETGSVWAPFLTPGAMPDPCAVDAAFMLKYHMKDGYPASANDLGSIWRGIKSLAPALGQAYKFAKPMLQTAVGALPGGGVANQVMNAVEALIEDKDFGKKVKQAKKTAKTVLKGPAAALSKVKPGQKLVLNPQGQSKKAKKAEYKRLQQAMADLDLD